MSNNNTREFWLWKTWDMPWSVHDKEPSHTARVGAGPALEKIIHVIEYRAVEQLTKQLESCQAQLKLHLHNHITRDIKPRGECGACDRYHDLEMRAEEIKRLTRKLEVAKKALQWYANPDHWEETTNESTKDGCGISDFSIMKFEYGRAPMQIGGKRARQALKEIEEG